MVKKAMPSSAVDLGGLLLGGYRSSDSYNDWCKMESVKRQQRQPPSGKKAVKEDKDAERENNFTPVHTAYYHLMPIVYPV